MASTAVASLVGLEKLPEDIRSRAAMTDANYADLYVVPTSRATDRSPEEWARAVLEGTPSGRSARRLWRRLALRLGPAGSPDHVQGWKIAERGGDWLRLEVASWYATAHAVVQVDEDQLSVAVFLRYDRPIAALIWPPVGVMHRRGVPVMLRQAMRGRDAS